MAIEFEKEWYKPICVKCPYFVNVEAGLGGMGLTYSTDLNKNVPKEPEPVVKCERPTDSACLGDNVFVQRLETLVHINRMVQLKRLTAKLELQAAAEAKSRNAQRNVPYKRGKVVRRKIKRSN